jgi:hypothetical protein
MRAMDGISMEEYCWPTSRCKSGRIWKADKEILLINERILWMIEEDRGMFVWSGHLHSFVA